MAAASSRKLAAWSFVLVGVLAMAGMASARVIQVGGGANWTLPAGANVDYTTWAASETFLFGDELVFNYAKNSHNVFLVNATAYEACDVIDTPFKEWDSGEDVVPLTFSDRVDYYFMCGVPGHCTQGQKFHIVVAEPAASPPAGTGPPAPGPSNSPHFVPQTGFLVLSIALVFLALIVL